MEALSMTGADAIRDEAAFSRYFERHRRELQVHCYRLTGSLHDAEDLTQETFLRAWRSRNSFRGEDTLRAWLYRIATNTCLDALRTKSRPALEPPPEASRDFEVPWLQPYPDELLEGLAAPDADPESAVVSKETIELAFIAAIQQLTAGQRAVLILRDVLGWRAKDTASLLDTSVASVNSSLQRARAGLQEHLPERRLEWDSGAVTSRHERELLERYIDATEKADPRAMLETLHEDLRFAMPPQPGLFIGRDEIVKQWAPGFDQKGFGRMTGIVTRANMQPVVACYRELPGESEFKPLALDVIRIEDGVIAEITTFPSELFPAFGLPEVLPGRGLT
jgi:RNA polymerase sigma-70 factor (ECF subfamily)